LSLPLLAWAGYVPGAREFQGLQALTLAYAVVPCMLKVLAAVLLYVFFVRPTKGDL
jgi:Na+/melibiose symporter-like transporter